MLRRRTDLHSAVGGVNLFRGHRFARYHVEIPVAACIVAPAVHRCAFKNILPAQRGRMGRHFAIVAITQRGFAFAHGSHVSNVKLLPTTTTLSKRAELRGFLQIPVH
jgi:hypothetical protein